MNTDGAVRLDGRGLRGRQGDKGDVGDVNPQMPILLEQAEEARDAAQLAAGTAAAQVPLAAAEANRAEGAADGAAASAALAESAGGPTYPNTAAGLAATSSGQSFAVSNGDNTVTVYLNVSGSAVAQRTLATTAALAAPTGPELIGTPEGGDLAKFLTSRQREIWITDFPWLADPTGAVESAAIFRAARDYLVSIGGGVIRMPPNSQFWFNSRETISVWEIGGVVSKSVYLALPTGVGLVGGGRTTTKIFVTFTGASDAVVAPLDPSRQKISDFEIQGATSTANATHGTLTFSTASYDHIMEDVEFSNLYIHDVGSYGLGNQLMCRNVQVKGIKTRRTGADGIDWKQRAETLAAAQDVDPTHFAVIDIAEFGERVGAGSPTGIGFRGLVHVDGISVRGIPEGMAGIQFVGGIVQSDDIRPSASMSTITNWYVEGHSPKGDAIGLSVFACAAVRVGAGTAKWASCQGLAATTSPYSFDDGSVFEGATVIPAHGRTPFLATAKGTHFRGARIISDKVYWDAKRGNLTAGQTVLPLPFASTTNGGAPRSLVKITAAGVRTILTETTDYAWTTNSVTLTAGAAADDQYFAVFAPLRGFRIEASNCSVSGAQDYFVPSRVSVSTQPFVDTGVFDIVWEGRGNVSQINTDAIAGLVARDPTVTDKNLVTQAQGGGAVTVASSSNKLAFFASTGGQPKQTVTGAKGSNAALTSLLAALAAYGLVKDSSS